MNPFLDTLFRNLTNPDILKEHAVGTIAKILAFLVLLALGQLVVRPLWLRFKPADATENLADLPVPQAAKIIKCLVLFWIVIFVIIAVASALGA